MNTTDQAKLALCPHCQSTFVVSQQEMQLALGAVRCGECMKIFNASYHFVVTAATIEEVSQSSAAEANQINSIPTLHEQHPEPAPDSNSTSPSHNATDEASSTDKEEASSYVDSLLAADPNESTPAPSKVKHFNLPQLNIPLIAGMALVTITLLVGGWFLINKTPPVQYKFSEIRLSPSTNSQKMDVHFTITNISEHPLPLPNVNIELLNLSSQAVSKEQVNALNLQASITQLDTAASHPVTATVKKPSTFVQSAHIQPDLDNPKL